MAKRPVQPALTFVALRTFKADKLLAFYGALGLSFREERHGKGPLHHSCDLGGTVLEIYPRRPGEADALQDGVIVGLAVGSVEEALAALSAAGFGAMPVPPAGAGRLLTANLQDPDGRKVMLTVLK